MTDLQLLAMCLFIFSCLAHFSFSALPYVDHFRPLSPCIHLFTFVHGSLSFLTRTGRALTVRFASCNLPPLYKPIRFLKPVLIFCCFSSIIEPKVR